MVRYTENSMMASNSFSELSEECQLAINGGCSNGLSAEEKAAIIFFFLGIAADHS